MQQPFFVTTFPNVRNTLGKRYVFSSVKQFFDKHIKNPDIRETKDGTLFSLGSWEENQRRGDKWRFSCGVILDFDNKHDATTFEEALDAIDFRAILYTTFSHSAEQNRFRLVVPCDGVTTENDYRETCFAVMDRMGLSAGFDQNSLSPFLTHYLPACQKKNISLFRAEYLEGEEFSRSLPAPTKAKPATKILETPKVLPKVSGRNEALKAQASAALGKGVSFETCVRELVAFDAERHQPPLFEDPAEGNLPGNPEAGAMKFVSNIWFSHARTHGEKPNVGRVQVFDDAEAEKIVERLLNKGKTNVETSEAGSFVLPEKLATGAPGLVGEIASWIDSTATKVQPVLSLGAALCAVATLKGHRVQTETGLRTNIYVLGLAPSGAGKEHPSRCIQLLMEQADCGQLISGEPASDVGLLKGIRAAGGRSLVVWDEIGHALQAITGDRASPHERKIVKVILQLFSKANSVYRGKEYANFDGKQERQDIDQPCLSVFGTTVPERFTESLKSAHVADGFLPRWLVFQIANPDVEERFVPIPEDAPKEFLAAIKAVQYLPTNVRAAGNLDALARIRPATIPLNDDARGLAMEMKHEFNRLRSEARGSNFGIDAIWNRGMEHTLKLALIVNDEEKIARKNLEWAYEIVKNCLNSSCKFAETLTDSEFERKSQRILEYIRQNPGISQRNLLKFARFAIREREQILKFLIESESIQLVTKTDKTGAGRPSKVFFAI